MNIKKYNTKLLLTIILTVLSAGIITGCGSSGAGGDGDPLNEGVFIILIEQNFDGLPNSGSSPLSFTAYLPEWSFLTQGSLGVNFFVQIAQLTQTAAGGFYSLGLSGSTNRSLGMLPTGNSANMRFGFSFTNNTGFTLSDLVLSYTGEQWRGGNTNSLTVDVSTTSNDISALTGWTRIDVLDFSSSPGNLINFPLDGKADENRKHISASLGISLAPNETLCVRWTHTGAMNSPCLAIDDLKITAIMNSK